MARNWTHGTFLGSIVGSEVTAATLDVASGIRRDPMAMKPFIGYNAGDYFKHWLDVGKAAKDQSLLPKIFYVNWFRKTPEGKWLWPGYGDNSRVLKWIFERCDGVAAANETAIGNLPTEDAIDMTGLNVSPEDKHTLLSVDKEGWKSTLPQFEEWLNKLDKYADHPLPTEIRDQLAELKARLG